MIERSTDVLTAVIIYGSVTKEKIEEEKNDHWITLIHPVAVLSMIKRIGLSFALRKQPVPHSCYFV